MPTRPITGPLTRSLSGGVTGVGVGGFSPSVLFAAGEQGAWYDPSDFSTMFQDTAGTTPVTAAGQLVGRMLDKSGNGLHLAAASDAVRPTLQVANGALALVGDGTKYLTCASGGNFAEFTFVGAILRNTASGIQYWFYDRVGTGGVGVYLSGASPSAPIAQLHNGTSHADVTSTGLTFQAGVPFVQVVGYDGTVAHNRKNGGTKFTRAQSYQPDSSATFHVLGNGGAASLDGAFFGGVYINRTLSDSETLDLTNYYYRSANIRPLIAVGDSHTYNTAYGQTMADFYPDRLDVLLGTTSYQVQNLGISGNTTANMVARISAADHARNVPYGVAVIYGGANDANNTFSVQASPAPTSTVFAVEAGRGGRFGAGAYITVNGEQAMIQSVATDTITLAAPLSFAPTAGQVVLIDTTANLVKLAQTINCPRTLICGQHFLNFASGGESTSGSAGTLETLRTKQRNAATQAGAVYVDFYDWMRDLIVGGTYTLGNDLAWHVAVGDTHLNNTGEQILADAIYAAMQAQGWA